MYTNRRPVARIAVIAIAAVLTLLVSQASAQTTTAALTGTVYDASGAVIPKATVSLKNEASGDLRRTVSNGEGYFTFAAVPPGQYTVKVEMDGFSAWEAKAVVLSAGDKRTVSGISLSPGGKQETVVVEASNGQITPVDSGEKSNLITEKIIQNVAIVGQNAAEFVKIMPGMAFTGGALNTSSYAAQDERTGNGPVGNFSANGQRTAALDITSDGAHIIDPGCNCGQAMNTNAEMTQEVKVMTSNFGADQSKGPVVISAIGKSGGQRFHGEAYTYNRYFSANANDWLNGAFGKLPNGQAVAPKPKTKYFYPGFNIGGPVIIPGTSFNKNRDKMFFFFGFEYYKQDVDNGVYLAAVPTVAMRNGDFSQQLNGSNYVSYLNGWAITGLPNNGNDPTKHVRNTTSAPYFSNGVLNAANVNPVSLANGQRLMNSYPLPNLDPSLQVAGKHVGWNYANAQTRFSNMKQYRGRVDYSFSDSTKLYVSYNHQHDNAQESLDTLWTGSGQSWASPTTPYPSPIIESTTSDVVSANLTKVFSPTLTNELVFSYTYLNLPNHFQNPNKVNRTGLGLDYQLLFNHPNPGNLILPQMTGWGDGISNVLNGGFELNGTVYAKKTLPSVADNVVKVWGTHTTKFGFYWERTWNEQPGNGDVNGAMQFAPWAGDSTGNAYADMLTGVTANYEETNYDVVPAFRYLSEEFYGQDSWKVSRRLTLEYGMRVSHLGPWVDSTGYGFAAWNPNLFKSTQGATANGVFFPGIEWNKAHSSTPLSGSSSRIFFYNPRVGFAWDILGTGRTVLRGGYGMYHYHDEQNVQNGAYGVVRGSFALDLGNQSLSDLNPNLATQFGAPANITTLDPTDSQEPRTQTYSLTVAQRLPWKSVMEVAYVGSKSDYLSNYNNNFGKINDLPVGAMFTANTCGPNGTNTGQPCGWTTGTYSTAQLNGARAYAATPGNCPGTSQPCGYGTGLKIINHQMYSNYNSMQVSWNKQSGPFTFMANYTYSKALGIRGENGAGTGDPTNLRNNYGTLPNNRTQIFNLAYVYEVPILHGANTFVKGITNGWQVSGIAQYQTGADLQEAVANNYNFNYSASIAPHTVFMGVDSGASPVSASASNILGTPDVTLMPVLTCNPRSGLKSHQYLNPNCFANFATPGQQGSYIIPAGSGPGFFNTDLSVFKNFTWGASETKKLQFRFSGYNFINHPLDTFIKADPNLNIGFKGDGTLANPQFGYATNKTGHRILQGSVKFSF